MITEQKIIINRKKQKNTYIRIDSDLNIVVSTSKYTLKSDIDKLIYNNSASILKMIEKKKKENEFLDKTIICGNEFSIMIKNKEYVDYDNKILYLKKIDNKEKVLKKEALVLFREYLEDVFINFDNIPYPDISVRLMKTRWGVCNVTLKKVTFNLTLLSFNEEIIKYVIIHELSHLIYADHSNNFWELVSLHCPNYKNLRKQLNNYTI